MTTDLFENPSAIEKADMREEGFDRRGLYYRDHSEFDAPVLIRGTNKQFTPFKDLVNLAHPSKKKLGELADACETVDLSITMTTIDNISELVIEGIHDSVMILRHKATDINYFLEMPDREESLPLKRFSTLLGIPYSFSRKNPAYLNKMNFEYWQRALTEAEGKEIPVDLIYMKEPVVVSVPTDGDRPHPDEDRKITGHSLVNILRALTRNLGRGKKEVVKSTLYERIPMWSSIVKNVDGEIQKYDPGMEAKLQSFSLGYRGNNNGRHYARVLLDSPESKIQIGDQDYFMCLNLESDFGGDHKDFGDTCVSFGLWKQTCSNGMGIYWSEQQKEQIKHEYVMNFLEAEGVKEGDESYDKIMAQAQAKFKMLFSPTGMNIPNAVANTMIESSTLANLVGIFFEAKDYIVGKIEELAVPFPEDIESEEFVDVAHDTATALKLSPELTKFFILEYLAGHLSGEQKFASPMDCLNFLTFMCRAYSSKIQMQVEKQAYQFASMLATTLIYKQSKKKQQYMNYLLQVQEELI